MKTFLRHAAAFVGTVLVIGAAVSAPSTASAGAPDTRAHRAASPSVYVVQGVPGASVTVTVDGRAVQRDASAKTIIGPLDLAQGKHTIAFRADSWEISSSFTVQNRSLDLVVHWPADKTEQPEMTVFNNDLRSVGASKGRVTVAHTAVVPPADVRVDKQVLFSNIANGEFVSADVPAGSYSVDIVPTGQQGDPVFGPVDLPVEAGLLTRVFAIGEPKNQSMDAIVQTLPLAQKGSPAPDLVDAGSAGLAATPETSGSGPAGLVWLSLLGAALAVGISALYVPALRRRVAIRSR